MVKKEICWNVTTRCNQNCRYCHRFLNIKDLKKEENLGILNNLIDGGVNEITWTGGEALLLEGIDELIELAYNAGIKNKIITNGKLLTVDRIKRISPFLDSITLSIDAVDNDINEELGRGFDHLANINSIMEFIRNNEIKTKLRINTVISKLNINDIPNLVEYLNNFNIYSWRIFKFMPLRETAVINQDKFDISVDDYNECIKYVKSNSKIKKIESRIEEDMQKKYLLILADGSIVVTDKDGDKKLGNALSDSILLFL